MKQRLSTRSTVATMGLALALTLTTMSARVRLPARRERPGHIHGAWLMQEFTAVNCSTGAELRRLLVGLHLLGGWDGGQRH